MNRNNLLALIIGLIIAITVATLAATAFYATGDDICEHAVGPGAEYLEGQPMWDSQLDCVAANGTVLRDVDVPPMNVSSTESVSVALADNPPAASRQVQYDTFTFFRDLTSFPNGCTLCTVF